MTLAMNIDEAISILSHACRFKPVALLACCAAEMTRIRDPQEQAIAFRLVAVLSERSAECLTLDTSSKE